MQNLYYQILNIYIKSFDLSWMIRSLDKIPQQTSFHIKISQSASYCKSFSQWQIMGHVVSPQYLDSHYRCRYCRCFADVICHTSRGAIRHRSIWSTLFHEIILQWRHNERDGVSSHQPHHYLLNRLFGCRSKKTPKLCVTGLCAGHSPVTVEYPA